MNSPRKVSLALVPLFLLAAMLAAGSPAAAQNAPVEAAAVKCWGVPATIVGTPGNDVLVGTPGDDVIVGLGGNDTILGGGGNDRLCGNGGVDRIIGGAGRDIIFGQSGADILAGDDENLTDATGTIYDDVIFGGYGPDHIVGGPGNDRIRGEGGNDYISAGSGDDDVDAGIHHDVVFAGEGDDIVKGFAGFDELWGGDGDDKIWGHYGADKIYGERGNDWINSGSWGDTVNGGLGADTVIGNVGRDTCLDVDASDTIKNCERKIERDDPGITHPCRYDVDDCLFYEGTSGEIAYVFGDSHSGRTVDAFVQWGKNNNISIYFQATSGCGWQQGVAAFKWREDKRFHCLDMQYFERPAMIDAIKPDFLLTTARNYDDAFTDRTVSNPDYSTSSRDDIAHTLDSLQYYQAVSEHLIVVETLPSADFSPKACVEAGGTNESCSFDIDVYASNTYTRHYAAANDDVSYVSWTHLVCDATTCPAQRGGLYTRDDAQHLDADYVRAHLGAFTDVLDTALTVQEPTNPGWSS